MFYGYYEHNLDDKGRIVIPSKMRNEAGNVLYIMKGYDGALSIFKKEAFEKLQEEVEKQAFNKKVTRDFQRVQLASTFELEVDKQGRIQIPYQLLEKYKIGKELVIIGVGNHIEIWDKKAYQEYEQQAINDFESIAENLKENE